MKSILGRNMPFKNVPDDQQINIIKKTSDLIEIINLAFIQTMKQNQNTRPHYSLFYSEQIPKISCFDYLKRCVKYLEVDEPNLIYMLIYIERYFESKPNDCLNLHNVHRLILTGLMFSTKFMDDDYFDNNYIALVGGIPLTELNTLERHFFFKINATLYVSETEYLKNKQDIVLLARKLENQNNKKYYIVLSSAEEAALKEINSQEETIAPSIPLTIQQLQPLQPAILRRSPSYPDLQKLRINIPTQQFFQKLPPIDRGQQINESHLSPTQHETKPQ